MDLAGKRCSLELQMERGCSSNNRWERHPDLNWGSCSGVSETGRTGDGAHGWKLWESRRPGSSGGSPEKKEGLVDVGSSSWTQRQTPLLASLRDQCGHVTAFWSMGCEWKSCTSFSCLTCYKKVEEIKTKPSSHR